MWINIVLGMLTLTSIGILIIYRRQIRSICRQLQFIKNNDTNKIIATELSLKEVDELADAINSILRKGKLLEADCSRKDNQLKETITNISHDIRTPLTSLKGYFTLLNDCDDEEKREQYTKIIETRINSLNELVEQLFTYVKLQNETYKLTFEYCNINKILYDSVFSFYEEFKRKNIEPLIEIPEEGCLIWANEAGIRRVMQNIIKNALDHGKETIVIDMKKKDNRVRVDVKNGYESSEPIDTKQVFQRFYKADASRNSPSTGLGLSIAYELVNSMNGILTADIQGNLFIIGMEFAVREDANQN